MITLRLLTTPHHLQYSCGALQIASGKYNKLLVLFQIRNILFEFFQPLKSDFIRISKFTAVWASFRRRLRRFYGFYAFAFSQCAVEMPDRDYWSWHQVGSLSWRWVSADVAAGEESGKNVDCRKKLKENSSILAYHLEALVQPVIVHGYARLIVLVEQRFGLVERDDRLTRTLLQSIHHLFESQLS